MGLPWLCGIFDASILHDVLGDVAAWSDVLVVLLLLRRDGDGNATEEVPPSNGSCAQVLLHSLNLLLVHDVEICPEGQL